MVGEPMRPYDPTAGCPKCGNKVVSVAYCQGYPMGNYCSSTENLDRQHLDRRCARCGYRWQEAVIATKPNTELADTGVFSGGEPVAIPCGVEISVTVEDKSHFHMQWTGPCQEYGVHAVHRTLVHVNQL